MTQEEITSVAIREIMARIERTKSLPKSTGKDKTLQSLQKQLERLQA